jgi:hypothetical protein
MGTVLHQQNNGRSSNIQMCRKESSKRSAACSSVCSASCVKCVRVKARRTRLCTEAAHAHEILAGGELV